VRNGALYRAGSKVCLVPNVRKTITALERMRGLLGRPPLQAGEGLLIEPCPSVHTFGMRYALDLVYLDPAGQVLKLVQELKPWRMSSCTRAHATLELPPGAIERSGIKPGDRLEWHGEQ
jgi:uncharacterized protein